MTFDLFNPIEETERKAIVNFAECEMIIEDDTDKNGKLFQWITFNLSPVLGSKYPNVISERFALFADEKDPTKHAKSRPWDTHVMPSILLLVKSGKLANIPAIDKSWVKWEWGEWLSYAKRDIAYWQNRARAEREAGDDVAAKISASKIVIDDGKAKAKKRYIHFLEIFTNESECQKAYVDYYGEAAVNDAIDDIPTGFDDDETELKKDDKSIASFLPIFILQFVNGKIDEDGLQFVIDDTAIFKKRFETKDHHVVQDSIAEGRKRLDGKSNMSKDEVEAFKSDLSKFILVELNLPF